MWYKNNFTFVKPTTYSNELHLTAHRNSAMGLAWLWKIIVQYHWLPKSLLWFSKYNNNSTQKTKNKNQRKKNKAQNVWHIILSHYLNSTYCLQWTSNGSEASFLFATAEEEGLKNQLKVLKTDVSVTFLLFFCFNWKNNGTANFFFLLASAIPPPPPSFSSIKKLKNYKTKKL